MNKSCDDLTELWELILLDFRNVLGARFSHF